MFLNFRAVISALHLNPVLFQCQAVSAVLITSSSSSNSSSSSRPAGSHTASTGQCPADSDTYYWHPHDGQITPSSIAQRRAVGRLENAIESVMLADATIREQLVERYGLTIHRIQLAKDRRTVFVLWDANQGLAQHCQRALEHNAYRLRRELARNLKSKFTPFIEFRHNHLPPLQAAVAAAIEQVEQEAANQGSAAAAGPAAADIDAAVARLEDVTRLKEPKA